MARVLLGLMLALLLFAAGGELLFRVLPVSTATKADYYLDPKILTYPPRHSWRVATGWDLRNPQTLHSNNLGWVSDHDFVPGSDAIALVGDSYVEASMLPAESRPSSQLERSLGGARSVYSFGGPGSSMLDYAERIRFAAHRLGLREFVVLVEPGDARQSLCGSGNVHSPCLDRTSFEPRDEPQPTASAVKRLFRHSAFAQYVYGQLKFDARRLFRKAFERSVPEPTSEMAVASERIASGSRVDLRGVDAVAATFLERISLLGRGLRVVFVVDGKRSGADTTDPVIAQERSRLIYRLRAAGFRVIDTEPLYAAHSASSPLSLNVGPYDGHLNAMGVGLVMSAVAVELRRPEP